MADECKITDNVRIEKPLRIRTYQYGRIYLVFEFGEKISRATKLRKLKEKMENRVMEGAILR